MDNTNNQKTLVKNVSSSTQYQEFGPIYPDRERQQNANSNSQLDQLFIKMRKETERLKTYRMVEWPVSFIKSEELSKVGFFYLLNRDRVQCAFCKGVVSNWEEGDVPLHEHYRHFPRCPFLLGYNVGNQPINKDPIRDEKLLTGHDVCGVYNSPSVNIEDRENSNETPKIHNHSNNPYPPGVIPHHGPKNPQYVSLDARIRSFSGKGFTNSELTPESLAEAGFYFIGVEDYVKCYYCDGGLCNWMKNDDPWVEHAHWFPECQFVILNKGHKFVESCEKKSLHKHEQASKNYPVDEDGLAKKALESWMRSKIVVKLLDINSYPIDVVRTVLHKRWLEYQSPFEHYADLQKSVEKSINRPRELRINSDSEEEDIKSSQGSSTSSISPSSSPPTTRSLSSTGSYNDEMLCKICLDKKVGVLFLPCGHLVACTQCALAVTDCPICRKHIDGTVRTLFT